MNDLFPQTAKLCDFVKISVHFAFVGLKVFSSRNIRGPEVFFKLNKILRDRVCCRVA